LNINRSTIARLGILIIILVTSGLIFASLVEDLVNHETLSAPDPLLGNWLLVRTTLSGNRMFSLITLMGNSLVISGSTALIGAWLAKEKRWSQLRLLLSTVGGAALLNLAFKNIFRHPRPDFSTP
jgi:membrane-associated phospholipid phosphatase